MVLLVFATELEKEGIFPNGIPQGYDFIITGIGILSTAISLSKAFNNKKYESAIQIGIAGAYRSSGLSICDVVEVKSDCLVDFVPWEPNTFFSTWALNKEVPRVCGATVLNCTKTEEEGEKRGKTAQIETMEGAAFFSLCNEYRVKATQIRAISNFAALYNKSEWKIKESLEKLHFFWN
jgi:nucleoside phosphorylase